MKLAALILSYNHPEHTERCVKSVLSHFLGPCYLIHNGSEKKFVSSLKTIFPQVQHIVLEKNKGFSGGANSGLKEVLSDHDWCFFITNDCELMTPLSAPQNPWSFVAPWIQLKKSGKTDSLGGKYEPWKAQLKHHWSEKDFNLTPKKNYIPGSAFYISKNVFFETGGFDESLQTYWEDVDLSERCKRSPQNIQLQFDKSTILHHGVGKTCRKSTHYTIYFYFRNQLRMSQKYSPVFPLTKLIIYFKILVKVIDLVRSKRFEDVRKAWCAIKDAKRQT